MQRRPEASPATPLTALAIAGIADDAGLPPGTFNVVTASPARTLQEELLNHPLIRKIAFTGSTATGRAIMAGAASQIKRLGFELGGNAPFIVFDDADLVAAVEGAVAIKYLRVAGQSCIAANRIYVHRSVADRFVPAFVDAVRALRVGPGFERGVQVGPLISAQARTRIHALVEDAVRRGARLATGGHPLTDGVRGARLLLRPHRPARRDGRDGRGPRGDLRAGRSDPHLRHGRRGRRARQRHDLRPRRLRVHA